MGCDIHLAVEVRKRDRWRRRNGVSYDWRNYRLFAILADVRNSYGIRPISEPRGLPADLSPAMYDDDDPWLGDHSHSWLTLAELLAYDWSAPLSLTGCVPLETFIRRQLSGNTGRPDGYSGGVMGSGVVILDRADALARLQGAGVVTHVSGQAYVREEWQETHAEAAGSFYSETLPALQGLAAREGVGPDDIRIVFGFDS